MKTNNLLKARRVGMKNTLWQGKYCTLLMARRYSKTWIIPCGRPGGKTWRITSSKVTYLVKG